MYRKARKFRVLNFRAFTETGKFCNIRGKNFVERNFRGFKTRSLKISLIFCGFQHSVTFNCMDRSLASLFVHV